MIMPKLRNTLDFLSLCQNWQWVLMDHYKWPLSFILFLTNLGFFVLVKTMCYCHYFRKGERERQVGTFHGPLFLKADFFLCNCEGHRNYQVTSFPSQVFQFIVVGKWLAYNVVWTSNARWGLIQTVHGKFQDAVKVIVKVIKIDLDY